VYHAGSCHYLSYNRAFSTKQSTYIPHNTSKDDVYQVSRLKFRWIVCYTRKYDFFTKKNVIFGAFVIFTLLAKLGQLYTYWEAISSITYLDMMHVKWFCQISFLCHPTWALYPSTRWKNGIFGCTSTVWHCICCCTSNFTKQMVFHVYFTSYTSMYQVSKSNFK